MEELRLMRLERGEGKVSEYLRERGGFLPDGRKRGFLKTVFDFLARGHRNQRTAFGPSGGGETFRTKGKKHASSFTTGKDNSPIPF